MSSDLLTVREQLSARWRANKAVEFERGTAATKLQSLFRAHKARTRVGIIKQMVAFRKIRDQDSHFEHWMVDVLTETPGIRQQFYVLWKNIMIQNRNDYIPPGTCNEIILTMGLVEHILDDLLLPPSFVTGNFYETEIHNVFTCLVKTIMLNISHLQTNLNETHKKRSALGMTGHGAMRCESGWRGLCQSAINKSCRDIWSLLKTTNERFESISLECGAPFVMNISLCHPVGVKLGHNYSDQSRGFLNIFQLTPTGLVNKVLLRQQSIPAPKQPRVMV